MVRHTCASVVREVCLFNQLQKVTEGKMRTLQQLPRKREYWKYLADTKRT